MENRDLIPNSLKIYYNSVFIISLSQYVLLKDLQEKCVANYQGIIDFLIFPLIVLLLGCGGTNNLEGEKKKEKKKSILLLSTVDYSLQQQ